MKRIILFATLIALPMLSHSAIPQDEDRERALLDSSHVEHQYVYKRVVAFNPETNKKTDQSFRDTYVTGTFLYKLPNGSCEIEYINLKSKKEMMGVEFHEFNIVGGPSSCERQID